MIPKNQVTIVIPHYQTHELVRLCLRSLRHYTPEPYRVIVVDNGSEDDSLDYLRSVRWITLIERKKDVHKMGSWAHGSALDIGLENTTTEFFLSLHSDVIIKDASWLTILTRPFESAPSLACVGTGKVEDVSSGYRLVKKMGDVKGFVRFLRQKFPAWGPKGDTCQPEYVRTTCAVYRTQILKQEGLSFCPIDEKGFTSGQLLYYELVERRYRTLYLPPGEIKRLMCHVSHGTMVLNPLLGARKRTISQGMRRIKRKLGEVSTKRILADDTLDQ